MRTLISAVVAMAALVGTAASASAVTTDGSGHCPAGYSNVWGTCFVD